MKAKLIDAYSLLETIRESREKNPHEDSKIRTNHTIEHDHIAHLVFEQPAAYDVDKIVSRINEIGKRYCDSVKCDKNCADCEHGCLMKSITDVVKGGLNVNG